MSSFSVRVEVYSIQVYVVKLFCDFQKACGFLWQWHSPPPYTWNMGDTKNLSTICNLFSDSLWWRMFEIETTVKHTTDFCVYIINIYNLEWTMKNDKNKQQHCFKDKMPQMYIHIYICFLCNINVANLIFMI